MGYYSHLSGKITFDPPADYAEIKTVEAALDAGNKNGNFYGSVGLGVDTVKEDTDRGVLVVKSSAVIEPKTEEGHKAYTVEDELRVIVTHLALSSARAFGGYILREGEENDDVERYVVKDGRLVAQRARFVFDDE